MNDTYGKMLELSANWDDAESIVQACAYYCDKEVKRLRELLEQMADLAETYAGPEGPDNLIDASFSIRFCGRCSGMGR